jgi:HK97 family phage portal protein
MGLLERLDRWMFGSHPEEQAIDKRALWGQGADVNWTPTYAGVEVSQTLALRYSAVWRCIRLISETLAGLPADVVRKKGDIRETVERPPSWLVAPNPETNWFEFTERCYESLLMDGNAFVLITARDATAFPSELWTLHPSQVEVRARNGRTVFIFGGERELSRYGPDNAAGDVLHIKLATAGGLRGMSPIEAARQAIGLGLVAEKFGSTFFGQGQQMSGVIQLPADQPARSKEHIDLMREQWMGAHSGSDKAHRPAILTGGATWQGITIPPDDAQFLETRTFQVEEIARFYGVPAHLIGLEQKDTSWGTGIESMGQAFYRGVLRGHIARFETAMSTLIPRGQYLRMNPRALIEADSATEANVLAIQLQNSVITPNYWRSLLDLPPRPGGDRYILPMNMMQLESGGVVAPPPEPAPPAEPAGAQLQEVPDEQP